MLGMSVVVLSSLWNGRINCTRIVFVYLAGLAFYYGAIKPMNLSTPPNSTVYYSHNPDMNARVPDVSEITGRGRK